MNTRRWIALTTAAAVGVLITVPAVSASGLARGARAAGAKAQPAASYPAPRTLKGDLGAHDPSAVRRPDGSYLVAVTGDNLPLKTSTDLVTFRDAGVAFPSGASWTRQYTAGSASLWAPDLSYHNGTYYLYYSASTFGSRKSAIFLATSTTGAAGSWTDRGTVVSTTESSDHNAIDPNLFVDTDGSWWLVFGSFWTGIKMTKLNPATGKPTSSSLLSVARRSGSSTAIEAPYLIRRGGYYYLFASWDTCCKGAASTYRIMVGRGTSATGPFTDRSGTAMSAGGGTELLASHGSIHGPGHEAVLDDGATLMYHYYADDGTPRLGLNGLSWDGSGWPTVS